MKRVIGLLLVLILIIPVSAYGICTRYDLEVKHKTLEAQIESLSKSDPQRSQRLGEEFVEKMNAVQQKAKNTGMTEQQMLNEVCKIYDDIIKKSK